MRKMLLILPFALSLAVSAHKPVKVQSLQEAVAKYTDARPTFEDWSNYESPKFLKTLSVADEDGLALFKFGVNGDWGPIHGLIAIEDRRVSGLEILVYTEHEGSGVTMAVFLNQFKNLTKENHGSAIIKPLPKEPKTSLALKEVIDTVFSRYYAGL